MELTRVMERDQQVQLEPSAKRRCNGTNVFSSVFSNGFHGGTNDHGGFRHAPVNGGHGWPGAMPNNSRRRMCGLYMPSYGGFSNLRGEICTVTIDKRHCSFLGVDIRVLECSQPEAERQAIIHNVQPHGAAHFHAILQPGIQVLSIDQVSVKGMDQVTVDQLLETSFNRSSPLFLELVLHLPPTLGNH